MIGVDRDGSGRGEAGCRLLIGTNSEIRGFLATVLVDHGLDPARLPKVLAAKRAQLYSDRKAARRKGLVGGRRAGMIAVDDAV
jgi:hypothetical protein